jgi:hypothetical protein
MRNAMKKEIRFFSSLEEENRFEYKRLASMTPDERLEEFAIIQERAWGKKWTSKPIKKVVSWEKVKW